MMTSTETTSGINIGLSDDDDVLREELSEGFRACFASVEPLLSPAEVELFATSGRLVNFVLDISMGPGRPVEGFETLKRLKQLENGLFVCIYSSYLADHPEYLNRANRLGADFVLSKSDDRLMDARRIVTAIYTSRGLPVERLLPSFSQQQAVTTGLVETEIEDTVFPPPRRFGMVRVRLAFKGKSVPLPVEDPWSE